MPDNLKIVDLGLSKQQQSIIRLINNGGAFSNPVEQDINDVMQLLKNDIDELIEIYSKSDSCSEDKNDWAYESIHNADINLLIRKLKRLKYEVEEFKHHTDRLSGVSLYTDEVYITPRIIIEDDYGNGAYAVPIVEDGKIKSINVLNPGSGYGGSHIVIRSINGHGAIAKITELDCNGGIKEIEVINGGSEYEYPIIILDNSYIGAAAIMNKCSSLSDEQIDINITNHGEGYLTIPPVVAPEPIRKQATIRSAKREDGEIKEIKVSNGGNGYLTGTIPGGEDITAQLITAEIETLPAKITNLGVHVGRLVGVHTYDSTCGFKIKPQVTVEMPPVGPPGNPNEELRGARVEAIISEEDSICKTIVINGGKNYNPDNTKVIPADSGCITYFNLEIVGGVIVNAEIRGNAKAVHVIDETVIKEPEEGEEPEEKGRGAILNVLSGIVSEFRILDPGSGYTDAPKLFIDWTTSANMLPVDCMMFPAEITGINGGLDGSSYIGVYGIIENNQAFLTHGSNVLFKDGKMVGIQYGRRIPYTIGDRLFIDSETGILTTDNSDETFELIIEGNEIGLDGTDDVPGPGESTLTSDWVTIIELTPELRDLLFTAKKGTLKIGTELGDPEDPTNPGDMIELEDDMWSGGLTSNLIIKGIHGTEDESIIISGTIEREFIHLVPIEDEEEENDIPPPGGWPEPPPEEEEEEENGQVEYEQVKEKISFDLDVTSIVISHVAPVSVTINNYYADDCGCYINLFSDTNLNLPQGADYFIDNIPIKTPILFTGGFLVIKTDDLDVSYETVVSVSGSLNGSGLIEGGIGYTEDDIKEPEFGEEDNRISKIIRFSGNAGDYNDCINFGSESDWDFPDLEFFINNGSIVGFEIPHKDGKRRGIKELFSEELIRTGCSAGIGFDGRSFVLDENLGEGYSEYYDEIAGGNTGIQGAEILFDPPKHARKMSGYVIPSCGIIPDNVVIEDGGQGYGYTPHIRIESPIEQYERVRSEHYSDIQMSDFIRDYVTPRFRIPRLQDDKIYEIETISSGLGGYPDGIELEIGPPEFTEFEDSEVYGVIDCAIDGQIHKEQIRITKSDLNLINPRLMVLGSGLGARVTPIINENGILIDFDVDNNGTCYTPSECKQVNCIQPDIEAGYQIDLYCQSGDDDTQLLWSGISKTPSGLYEQRCGTLGGCVEDLPYLHICDNEDNKLKICSSEITIEENKTILIKLDNTNINGDYDTEWKFGDEIYLVIKHEEDCKDPKYTYTKIGTYEPCDTDKIEDNEVRIYTELENIPENYYITNTFNKEQTYNRIISVNYIPLYGFIDGETISQGSKKLVISKVYDNKLVVFGSDLSEWDYNSTFFGETSKVCNLGNEYNTSLEKILCEYGCNEIVGIEWDGTLTREGSREIWKIITDGNTFSNVGYTINTLLSKIERNTNITQCPPEDFGRSISMYEDYCLIGSANANSVYLFKRGNNDWKQVTRITHEIDSNFGYKVSLHKNVMAIYAETINKIFVYEGSDDTWTKVQEIEIETEYCDMKITKDYLVIGLHDKEIVEIYTRNPKDRDCRIDNNWILSHTLKSEYENIDYGFSVDIQKDWLAVGAISGSEYPLGNEHGVVFIYRYYEEQDMWIEQDRLIPENKNEASFGYSLSFDPDCCRIAIGNPYNKEVEIHECSSIEDKELYIPPCAGAESDYQNDEYTPNSYRVIFDSVLPCRTCSYFITIGHDYCLEQIDRNTWAKNLGGDREIKLVAENNKFKLEAYAIDDNIDERIILFRGEIDIINLTSEYSIENEFKISDCGESAGYDGLAKLIPCCVDPNLPDNVKVQKYEHIETIYNDTENFGQSISLESPYITIGASYQAFEYVRNENIKGNEKIWNFVKEFHSENGDIIGSSVSRSQMFSAINTFDNINIGGSVCFYQLSGLYSFVTGVGCDALIHPVPDVCYNKINKINIDNPGRGYQLSNKPVDAYIVGGCGCGAKIKGNVKDDSISSFDVISGGCDYVNNFPNLLEVISTLSLSNMLIESIDTRDKSLDKPFVISPEVIDTTTYRVEYIPVNTHLDSIQKGMMIIGSESGATALFNRYETKDDAVFSEFKEGRFTGNHVYIYNVKGKFKEGEIVRTEMNTQSMHLISGPSIIIDERGKRPKPKDPNEGYIKYIDDEGNVKYKKPEQITGPVDNFTKAFNSIFHGSEYMNYIRQVLKDGTHKQLENSDNPNLKIVILINLIESETNRLCNIMRDDHRAYIEAKRIVDNYNLSDFSLSRDEYTKLLIKTIGNETLINNLED